MISATSTKRTGPPPLLLWVMSSIGKKTIVALSGIALVLFVTGHLLGNMTIYLGPDWINSYAKHLADLGPMLWVIRFGLLTVVVLHIFFTMLLWKENQSARPQKYVAYDPVKTTVASRTMRLSGLIVLAFIVFHLAHFTVRIIDPSYQHMETMLDGHEVHDVFKMVVIGFSNPWIVAVYLVGLFLLTLHLSHGIGSLFQTLGITNRRLHSSLVLFSRAYAWALFVGYASIPISILVFGVGRHSVP
ncbi:MAG: succinate dehydrogenase cytochrome b subunit [Terrimicrobiaceae bacterium]|nr:succinate dehydrogenase cytochrome b subunit [Terrimicrobiaceae bacterium]